MDLRRLFSNFSVALLAQLASLLTSVFITFLVPKFLNVSEFGYWQLFIFYSSYAGLLTFGLNDGVYLRAGGMSRLSIDKRRVGSQFYFCCVMQLCFSLAILAGAWLAVADPSRREVCLALGLYTIVFNLSGFLGYLFQALNETKLYSYAMIISRLSFLPPLIVLLLSRSSSSLWYIGFYIFAQVLALLFCISKAQDFLKAKPLPMWDTLRLSLSNMRIGIKLVLANIASMLILGVMRFAIDDKWGIDTFGAVSFALSLVTFILAFVMQLSMVLFPALRQTAPETLGRTFANLQKILGLTLPLIYLGYFPLTFLVNKWLPQYGETVLYLGVLLPVCLFDSKMSLLGGTFLKVLRKEGVLLAINAVSTLLSLVGVVVAVYVVESVFLALVATLLAILLRSVMAERIVSGSLQVPWGRGVISDLLLTGLFLFVTLQLQPLFAVAIYCCALGIHYGLSRKELVRMLHGWRAFRASPSDPGAGGSREVM